MARRAAVIALAVSEKATRRRRDTGAARNSAICTRSGSAVVSSGRGGNAVIGEFILRPAHDARLREELTRALPLLGEQGEHAIKHEHLKDQRQLAHERLPEPNPRAGLAHHAQPRQPLAYRLARP